MRNSQESQIKKRGNIYIKITLPTENCDFIKNYICKERIDKSDACVVRFKFHITVITT